MLIELRIRDFLVIEDLSVGFGPGLVALTGETGAGKSILAGALGLLLGDRASADAVRSGADRARVEGVFDLSDSASAGAHLEEAGLTSEGALLILRREVAAAGRSRAWVNGSPVTATQLSQLGAFLADLHGQHEHQRLLRRSEQRALLDAFAGAGTVGREVAKAHRAWTVAVHARDERLARLRELEGRADFLRFQIQEIDALAPDPERDGGLDSESRRLEHAEELSGQAERLGRLLYAGDKALADQVADAVRELERLARLDPDLQALLETLTSAKHGLTEVGRDLGSYASRIDHDPGRLEEVRRRLHGLSRLQRKYGGTLGDVIATRESLGAELSELENADVAVQDAEAAIAQAHQALLAAADELSRLRDRAARELSKAVQALLPELGLPGATFQILLERQPELGIGGAETVEFRATLNPGFDPTPLARAASGGELSRVMLALKAVLVDVDPVPTLVFDEVDAGVGGAVATQVAGLLARIATQRQVFVITHLAQVASRATAHYRVEKGPGGKVRGLASSHVRRLEGDERIAEVARMLGGDPESAASRAHAQELLVGAATKP